MSKTLAFSMKAAPKKQYGLIMPKKKLEAAKPAFKRANIFGMGDQSDEEEDTSVNAELLRLKAVQGKAEMNRKTFEALQEDSSTFAYDDIFDEIQMEKEAASMNVAGVKKSKYIGALLEKAKERELYVARVNERNLQKEREAEGEMYSGKEKFVTSAYKKHLRELELFEEVQSAKEKEEAETTIASGDMSGFYANFLDNNEAMGGGGGEAGAQKRRVYASERVELKRQEKERARIKEIKEREEHEKKKAEELRKEMEEAEAKRKAEEEEAAKDPTVRRGRAGLYMDTKGRRDVVTHLLARPEQFQSKLTEETKLSAKERYLARKAEAEESRKKRRT